MSGFAGAAEVVQRGVDERAFPAAVVEVGTAGGLLWSQAFGRLDTEAESAPTQQSTIFDLASLTKVIATTTLVMRLVERGVLALDHPIRRWIREWRGNDREDVTVRALLTHSSGSERVASVFPRLHRAPGISARHCVAAARVSPRLTVHL